MRKLTCILISLSLLLVCLTAGADSVSITIPGKIETSIPIKSSYKNNPVLDGISSTTGLPSSEDAYVPIMVVLDNAEDAYPHWGVSQADIMFQVPNAGKGATKLLALFADQYPEQAGGVRSARATMIPLARAWDAAFAYAGPSATKAKYVNVDALLSKWKMTGRKAFNLLGNHYRERVDYSSAPHNLSCHVREIYEKLISTNVKFEERPFLFTDEPLSRGADASVIDINHYGDTKQGAGNHASRSSFTYVEEEHGYARTNARGINVDRTTHEMLIFSNVIVLRTALGWQDGYAYLRKHLVGSGTAEIFQNGKYIQGAWARTKDTDRVVFLDENGEELRFQRGKTFIVVTNDVTEVTYRS